jgi:hypothetical protein
MTKKIAILWHEKDRTRTQLFEIYHAAKVWEADGIEVTNVFGTDHFVPADLAILHIDLTIVPDEFFEFSKQYPIVLNREVRDIRKSTFSDHIVHPGDHYQGEVIVKSNLNHAGLPERRLEGLEECPPSTRIGRVRSRMESLYRRDKLTINSPVDYQILNNSRHIPKEWYGREDIVIEKFLPEIDNGHYCIRNYFFIGDSAICILKKATHPIVNRQSTVGWELVEVDPKIVEARKELHFDFGKFDYVIHDNKPVLLDINKTPGGFQGANAHPLYRKVMSGIYSYFSS